VAGRGDLPTTTGFPVSGSIGVHADLRLAPLHTIRPRLDVALFWKGSQHAPGPVISQDLETRVSSVGVGADYLFRLGGEDGAFALGAHLSVIRWAIQSTNTISIPSGEASVASGTVAWWRPAAGLLCEYRVMPTLSAEARLVFSRYGNEGLQANTASLGFLWDL
jgi:hypothetical protein